MPIYVYRCENGHTFEVLEPHSAPRERACGASSLIDNGEFTGWIDCGAKATRVMAAPSIGGQTEPSMERIQR